MFYRSRRYQDAIREFKRAQSIVYRLLNPQHSIDQHIADDRIMLPVGKAIERSLADASLRLVENIRKDVAPPAAAAAVAGVAVPPDLAAYQRLGFQLEGMNPSINAKIAQGADLIKSGNGAQAVDTLNEAIALIGSAGDATSRAALAAATLNLSSAQLAQGDANQGIASARRAAEMFQGLQDDLGRAQALHNQAVALQLAGQPQQAKPLFDQAVALFTTVNARWNPTAATAAPASPTTPSPVGMGPAINPPSIASASPALEPLSGPAIATRLNVPAASAVTAGALGAKLSASALSAAAVAPAIRVNPASIQLTSLRFILARDANTVALRWPGAAGGWAGAALPNPAESAASKESWSVGILTGKVVTPLVWTNGNRPDSAAFLNAVYQPRTQGTVLEALGWRPTGLGEGAAYLTHVYGFVIPQSLGDCYQAAGNYERAEQYYLQTAQYSYLNPALEAPGLWTRLARNVADWGDALYRDERLDEARAVYSKLIQSDGKAAATSALFTTPSLAQPAAQALALIQDLSLRTSTNPAISLPILTILARWRYLNAGLDFFGTSFTPVFTFEYLQQVARGFAEQAIQAEREYVNFQVQAEAEAATRHELQGALTLAQAQVQVSQAQLAASQADTQAAQLSVGLAQLRAQQAQQDREAYRVAGYWEYKAQSIAAAHGAHSDWHGDEIRRLAADMEKGSWEGEYGKLAAAATLLGGQKSYEYQLGHMDRVVNEMNAMIPITQAQLASAQAREEAARLAVEAAEVRRDLTADALAAFENEVFTPELWAKMAEAMRDLSRDYQYWAIRSAKLMQRAYNFETDSSLSIIKSAYPATATQGLLGSDYLLRDIESFTYQYLVHTRGKTTNLKEVISLSNEFPFQFYDLQRTGKTTFETSLLEFDRRNPGFYNQRLSSVEVEMIALMPPGGVHGYLRSGTISRYRTESGEEKTRIHTSDTLALSEFTNRGDAFLFRGDPRMHGLFEGHGVAGTWELALPKRSNNLDYRLITDVRLVFYYTAQFSPALKDALLARAPLPGEMIHVKNLQPRWDFPESWYSFLDTLRLEMDVTAAYLPRNETNFRTDKIAIQILTAANQTAENVKITLTLPGKAPATLITNAQGAVATEAGNAFAAQMGGPLLGTWLIQIEPPAGSPLLDLNGRLNSKVIAHVSIVAQYAFDWPA
jgi:hypothetical protein